jgi:hypothetical protein
MKQQYLENKTDMDKKREHLINDHEDLEVYQLAFDTAMKIFELSKNFPPEEKYSLTDQIGLFISSYRNNCILSAKTKTKIKEMI